MDLSTQPSSPSLSSDQNQQDVILQEFRAGVTAVLRSWSALRAGVEAQWGGLDSAKKAEELRDEIYRIMDGSCFPPKNCEQWDLEDNLAIFMEEQFSIVLEDDSEKQVAETLWTMYEACMVRRDVTLARQAVDAARRFEAARGAYPVQVRATLEQNESDDEDTMETDENESSPQQSNKEEPSAATSYASGSLFAGSEPKPAAPPKPQRQLGEAAPEVAQPEMDEDGFAPVKTKSRRNRN